MFKKIFVLLIILLVSVVSASAVLEDVTNYNTEENTCVTSQNGFEIYTENCQTWGRGEYTQIINFKSNIATTINTDWFFRFDDNLSNFNAYLISDVGNTTQEININDKFEYAGINLYSFGKYYKINNIDFVQGQSYKVKFVYSASGSGKYDIFGKLSSDTLIEAVNNNRYIYQDPYFEELKNNTELYYTMDINGSASTLDSHHSENATLNGGAGWSNGFINSSIEVYKTSNGDLSIPHNSSIWTFSSGDWSSITFRYYPLENTTTLLRFFSKGRGTSLGTDSTRNAYSIIYRTDSKLWQFSTRGSTAHTYQSGTDNINWSGWNTVTIQHHWGTGNDINIWSNGKLVSYGSWTSGDGSYINTINNQIIDVGCGRDSSGTCFYSNNYLIDEIYYTKQNLTNASIQYLYNNNTPDESLQYPFLYSLTSLHKHHLKTLSNRQKFRLFYTENIRTSETGVRVFPALY